MATLPECLQVDCAIVGGGMFGAWLALHLRSRYDLHVAIVEREPSLLRRASFHNQARVHNGYHYPRSILTGLRSRVNSGRFLHDYAECVDTDFRKYYAIGRVRSNVTAAQFERFCARIGAPLEPAEPEVRDWFDPTLIEKVWRVEEWAFDAAKLAHRMTHDLDAANVPVWYRHEAKRVVMQRATHSLALEVVDLDSESLRRIEAKFVFNATYSDLNGLVARSGAEKIALKQEVAELALVEMPKELERVGVTVMCGPFFSFMPFPARNLHSFSHVRYTPHRAWYDRDVAFDNHQSFDAFRETTAWQPMLRDSQRYMPALSECRYRESLFELKTVLPQSEGDDSRPILFLRHQEPAGLISVLGGKIDNVYDLERELADLFVRSPAS